LTDFEQRHHYGKNDTIEQLTMDSAAACFFPTLNTTMASQDEMQIYLAPVHLDLVRLQEFSSTREVPAACVVSAAWLLVLRLYTGCDMPSTGFVQTEGAQLQSCSVDFEDGSLRLHQIIDSLRFHMLENPSETFNTAVATSATNPVVRPPLCLRPSLH
jgi:hypothetical protein